MINICEIPLQFLLRLPRQGGHPFCVDNCKLLSDMDVDFRVMVSNHQSLSDSQRLKLGEIVDRCRLKLMRFADEIVTKIPKIPRGGAGNRPFGYALYDR